jgi:hypothetical protein
MAGWAARRHRLVVACALPRAYAGAALALWRLQQSPPTGTVDGSRSEAARATALAHERFGDVAIYVLVRGVLPRLARTSDVIRPLWLSGGRSGISR